MKRADLEKIKKILVDTGNTKLLSAFKQDKGKDSLEALKGYLKDIDKSAKELVNVTDKALTEAEAMKVKDPNKPITLDADYKVFEKRLIKEWKDIISTIVNNSQHFKKDADY